MGFVSGGELAARALVSQGVNTVFAIHGGHLNPFLLACSDLGVRFVDGRHEGASGHSADGYARATGGLGVAAVTAGAGFANCLPAIVSAHLDRVPLLVITSSPPLRESELNELQGGVDQVAVVRPITRWAHRVTSTERIPDLVGLAVRKALAAPPGPVLLDIPVDVMFGEVDEFRVATSGAPTAALPAPAEPVVAEVVRHLETAQRPVVVAGNGIRYAHAADALVAFADRAVVPVFGQMGATGLPAGHALHAGGAWNLGMLESELGSRPDLVLLVGARLGRFLGGRTGSMIPDDAALIQVDVDLSEIGRVRPVDLAVVADARETLQALTAAVGPARPDRWDWAKQVVAVNRRPSAFADEPAEIDGRLHPYHAVRAALRALDPATTVVVDGGEAAGWVWESLAEVEPRDIMGFGGYLGLLGLSTGLGIGAQAARPDGRVVVFCGDGAAGFHIQEIDTMVRHGLPVVTVVVNNALWAQSVRSQHRDYGSRGEVISHLVDTAYDRVAEGFGAHGERVTTLAEVGPAVRRALDSGRPALVNLAVAYGPEPRTAAGMGRKPATDEIAVPYYEAIPKSPY
ncbi:thiamine pyrophosphate-binding protein [Pseudonocardia dioxanivorans]|jgi:acetolactate synthase-1/2/3 large subunit|uniref:thiamine pyrophosphate-binding protein n=1 Tax=Pseudonocardia dioxanivorans TaxID=240495 RepID=UPI000CD1DB2D|nr:thiamine pyrophosphate-binding protein [Pseudonocardia dioxanivorans]